jgi:hypothetical protein
LRDIEQKLQTVGCIDQEKVRYATHQLFGPAATWWRNVQNIIPQDHIITWDEFKKRFRENYVPESIMEIKRKEFLNLKQESRTITAYLDRFNDLSHYAPDDTNTEAKKVYRFIEGLSPSIQLHIAPVKITEFQELVDRVILIENRQVAVDEERRKRARLDPRFLLRSGSRPAGPARTPMNGPPRPYMTGPPRPPITGPPQPTFDQPPRPVFRPPKAPIKCHICSGPHMARECPTKTITCYGCGLKGHYKNECPNKGEKQPGTGGAVPNQLQRQANSAQVRGNTSVANRGRGRGGLARGPVHLTHMDAAQVDASADVVTGNLLIPPAVGLVLFDPVATHSFISRQFDEKHSLEHTSLAKHIEVHSPGG